MTSIPPDNKKESLPKSRRSFVRNIKLDYKNMPKFAHDIEYMFRELASAIVELQKIKLVTEDVDEDLTPKDGARCELFDGQFVKLVQTAVAPQRVLYTHKLGRVPQGGISVSSSGFVAQFIIPGIPTFNIPPANEENLTIILGGNVGDTFTYILF